MFSTDSTAGATTARTRVRRLARRPPRGVGREASQVGTPGANGMPRVGAGRDRSGRRPRAQLRRQRAAERDIPCRRAHLAAQLAPSLRLPRSRADSRRRCSPRPVPSSSTRTSTRGVTGPRSKRRRAQSPERRSSDRRDIGALSSDGTDRQTRDVPGEPWDYGPAEVGQGPANRASATLLPSSASGKRLPHSLSESTEPSIPTGHSGPRAAPLRRTPETTRGCIRVRPG